MPIQAIGRQTVLPRQLPADRPPSGPRFAALMEPQGAALPRAGGGPVVIGRITPETPTVSHILKKNPAHAADCWRIINAGANHGKAFDRIPDNAEVLLDPATNEITWRQPVTTPPAAVAMEERPAPAPAAVTPPPAPTTTDTPAPAGTVRADGSIAVGTIGKETPTVSHVLKANPIYAADAWNIIFSKINQGKPFTTLRPGTEILIDPQTMELRFEGPGSTAPKAPVISRAAQEPLKAAVESYFQAEDDFSSRLADAVRSYIGKPYGEMDCYNLVINGLRREGVRYNGPGGLRRRMEEAARAEGKPLNAYQNGEGLIKTAGRELFSKSFSRITNPNHLTGEVYDAIEPLLRKGEILSFSTPSRGHTGVISNKNGQWTYINSGLMDHRVDNGRINHRVGEERLRDEIANWFALARHRNEPLSITVGALDEDKLKPPAHLARR